MKTIIEITNDYNSNDSFDLYNQQLIELKKDMDIYVTVENNNFNSPIKDSYGEAEDFNYKLIVSAKGYVQSEWQVYNIYHNNKKDEKLEYLTELLERRFTHFNDYFVSKFDRQEINGKDFDAEPHDFTTFSITDIEFPSEEDVIKTYNDFYGKDYDEVVVSID